MAHIGGSWCRSCGGVVLVFGERLFICPDEFLDRHEVQFVEHCPAVEIMVDRKWASTKFWQDVGVILIVFFFVFQHHVSSGKGASAVRKIAWHWYWVVRLEVAFENVFTSKDLFTRVEGTGGCVAVCFHVVIEPLRVSKILLADLARVRSRYLVGAGWRWCWGWVCWWWRRYAG